MTDSISRSPRQRVQWTAADKSEWLELFRKSGQGVRQFCSENDLSPSTLALWLRPPPALQASDDGELVEVPRQVVAELASANASAVTMQLPGGVRLEIAPGTDPAWLAQLVRAFAPVDG